MKLSIIVPVFNEEKTIQQILQKLDQLTLPNSAKEIIVVDDGSTDATSQLVKEFIKNKKNISLITQENTGKGGAVRRGIAHATGDYIIIQDADLEYNPKQIIPMLREVQKGAQVVYGTRLKRLPHFAEEERKAQFLLHYLGNKFLSLLTSILYGQWITDMETCYKLFPMHIAKRIHLKAKGFELEPELTAKLSKIGLRITEIPIIANPRGYSEGKKLNTVTDGLKAVYTLLKYRFYE